MVQEVSGEDALKIKVLKLGKVYKDIATQLQGMLTLWAITLDRHVLYVFQPKGLDENGMPVMRLLLGEARLVPTPNDDNHHEEVEVDLEILGSIVTDKASGFTGTAIELVYHVNGCFHVVIQPAGLTEKTKEPIKTAEFDIRQCTGRKIKELSPPALQESKVKRPSPAGDMLQRAMPLSVSRRS